MTEPVRVHIRVPGTDPMPRLMKLIQSIEAAGFDGAGILDSQMLSRDTFVVLGQAAAQTTRLALFPAVTNPFTRHASVLASAIQTVEELAPGRVRFVIGTGYTSASTIGRSPARGSRDHLGGPDGHAADDGGSPPSRPSHSRPLGHSSLGRLLAGACRPQASEDGDPGGCAQGLSRPLPCPRLGGRHRGDLV